MIRRKGIQTELSLIRVFLLYEKMSGVVISPDQLCQKIKYTNYDHRLTAVKRHDKWYIFNIL